MAHGLPGTRYTTWFAFALVVGLLFGLLYAYTGSLLAPTLAHFTINFFNLLALAPDRTPAPGPPEET